MTAAESLSRAFIQADGLSIDEAAVLAAVNVGLCNVLRGEPLRFLLLPGAEQMLWWWLAKILPRAASVMPYLRPEPDAAWCLCCEGADCLGFGCVDVNRRNMAILRHGFVLPERRREGIGSELLRQRLAYGREQGVAGFQVTANRETRPLYLREGFKEVGTRGRYFVMVRSERP